jgi:hypothetical protein
MADFHSQPGIEEAKQRVAEIDTLFEHATGWGSWMVMAANERERLADKFGFEHKWQARCGEEKRPAPDVNPGALRDAICRGANAVFPGHAGDLRRFANTASDADIKAFFRALALPDQRSDAVTADAAMKR